MSGTKATPDRSRPPELDDQELGGRIRALREQRGRTLRSVAAEIGISASALSQMEKGRMRPSVTRLYQIASLLDASLDQLFTEHPAAPVNHRPPEPSAEAREVVLRRADELPSLTLEQGVRWRRLNPAPLDGLEVLEVTYAPGACSSRNAEYLRHSGREIGSVLSGALHIDLGFTNYELGPGDSIEYPSTTPHRIINPGKVPAVALWVVLAAS